MQVLHVTGSGDRKSKSPMCSAVFARSFLDNKPRAQVTHKFWKPKKKLHKPELFLPKHGRFGNFDIINLQETSSTVAPICVSAWSKGSAYLPLLTFKERNSCLFCPIFLKFTFDNFTSPVGLAIVKFYMPGPNFTSLGLRTCTIFPRLAVLACHICCRCSMKNSHNSIKGQVL